MLVERIEGGVPVADAAEMGHLPSVRLQVAAAVAGGRPRWSGGPVVASAYFAGSDQPGNGAAGD